METETSPSTSLRDLLYVVFKRKTQILLFFGATVCTVAIASFMTRPTYEATAQILIRIGREDIYVPTLPAGGISRPVIRINREERINSEVEILKSRFLAEKVVESLGPAVIYEDLNTEPGESSKAARRLQKNLTVEPVRKSNVINISFTHPDPHLAATVINTLVNFYLERHLEVHKSPQSYKFFQGQSQILRDKMNQAGEKLKTFKKEHDLTSFGEEQSVLLRQMADLRSRLVDLELKEHELLIKYTGQSRLVQGAQEEIQIVRRKLSERESRLNELNQIETEFNRLQEEVQVNRQNYRLYLSKFEESRISKAMDEEKMANVSLIEPARPPDTPVRPKIRLNMVLAIFVGGFGGVGLAWVSEYLNDSLDKDEDVENHLHLPVLASIPEFQS